MINQDEIILFLRDTLSLSGNIGIVLTHLAVRGSEREFFRARWCVDNSCIVIRYDPGRMENTLYADIGVFLKNIQVSVPDIIGHDPDRCLIIMEDLGNTDLWSLRDESWGVRQPIYERTLDIIHRLHSFSLVGLSGFKVRFMDGFDLPLYRWEQGYFFDNLVNGVCGIQPDALLKERLDSELSTLSERLMEMPQCLIHRDLQSQNIMVREGRPYLIDFQGMRTGSLFYDLGSLLNDPYAYLAEEEKNDLLSYYYRIAGLNMEWGSFQLCFWEASVERLMQALGAYGFLGYKKGLKTFLQYIGPGIEILIDTLSNIKYMPHLQEFVLRCRDIIKDKSFYSDRCSG